MIEKILDMIAFAKPLRIIERPDKLVIQDYRPTWWMVLCFAGFLFFAGMFVTFLIKIDIGVNSVGLWGTGLFSVGLLVFAFRGTIREVYYFDRTTDSYAFVRQFIHRKEVIEGAMSQFTGAYVKTVTDDESKSYFVMLRQDGMFLTGVSEQTLREVPPILNSFSNEGDIANAISAFLSSSRTRG